MCTTAELEPQSPRAPEPARRKCERPGPRAKRPSEKPPPWEARAPQLHDNEDPAVPKINKAAKAVRVKKGYYYIKNVNTPNATIHVKMAKMVNFMFSIFYHNKEVYYELGQFRLKDNILKVKN